MQKRTCIIWSSFLTESDDGPKPGASGTVGELTTSRDDISEPARGRADGPPSLGLLVLAGLVWGEVAGEVSLGVPLGCWCMAAVGRGGSRGVAAGGRGGRRPTRAAGAGSGRGRAEPAHASV